MSENESLGMNLAMAGLALGLLFGAHACNRYESPAMRSEKPAAVAAARNRARRRGPENSEAGATESYDVRYHNAIAYTKTAALKELENHGIAILLDARLSHQHNGLFDREAIGIYYPKDKVICLYDNGRDTKTFIGRDADDHSVEMLEKFAEALRDGKISSSEPTFAGRYSRRIGKTTTYYVRWDSASDFDRDTQVKNPALNRPPSPPAVLHLEAIH